MKKKILLSLAALLTALSASPAFATLTGDASAAITAATGDATTVGGYVVAAVAVIAGIALILTLVRKI